MNSGTVKRMGSRTDSCSSQPQKCLDRARVRASIVIVNHNGGEELLACLRSVFASIGPVVEVIVVDNRSTDGSAAAVERLFPRAKAIRLEQNQGYGSGNNAGAEAAGGEFLVFLNPDTTVEEGWLEGLLEPLDSDEKVGLTTCRIVLAARPQVMNTAGNGVHMTGLTLCRGMGCWSPEFDRPADVAAVSGAAFAIRREVFGQIGGFDPTFFLYMEDTDLSLRARLAGWQILYAPKSVIRHDYALRFSPRKVFYQERNRYLMVLSLWRWGTILALLPALALGELVTWGFVLWRERSRWRNKLDAYAWVPRNWPVVFEKRRQVQATREVSDRSLLKEMGFALDFGQVSQGAVGRLARLLFDPIFFLLRAGVLAVVWW